MLTAAHTPEIIEDILTAYREVFEIIAEAVAASDVGRRLEGPPLQVIVRDL